MQRERQDGDAFFNLDRPFRSSPGFANFPSIFGARDPFDDPFFTRPFASFTMGNPFGGDPFRPTSSTVDSDMMKDVSKDDSSISDITKGVVIEELESDDESELEEEQCGDQMHRFASPEPSIEHPDEDAQGERTMALTSRVDHNVAQRANDRTKSFSVHTSKVTYGGVDGTYYTSTRTRSRGSDGVVLEESTEADRTTGQATHRISRGINDKGHSVTRMLNSDGKADTVQTLHNLREDELSSFERSWTANGRGRLPHSRDDIHGTQQTEGTRQSFVDRGRPGSDASTGSSRKVVRINID